VAEPKYKDSEKLPIHSQYFQGGQTIDYKLGIPNSFFSAQALDFRSQPSQMTVQPGLTESSNGNLKGLVTAMEQDLNGVRWAITDTGFLHKINTSGVVSNEATLTSNGTAGLYYDQITDQLYIPGTQTVSMYGQVTTGNTGQPTFRPDNFGASASADPGCVNLYNANDGFYDGNARNNIQSQAQGVSPSQSIYLVTTNSAKTYQPQTLLSEADADTCVFAPDIEPFYSIQVYIVSKGTGNWTLTLHDSLDTPLAAVTVSNGTLISGQYNEFKFSGPIRAIVQQSQTGISAAYHWHMTSTVADGTIGTLNTGDMSSADFLLFAYRLVTTNNGFHPTAYFNGLLCVGNGRYLSTYDFSNDASPANTQWVRHQLIFKSGFEVCGLSTNNQYLVIALERRSASASKMYQDGQLAFWDGTTQNPAFIIDVPMGAPYGLQTFNNVTYFICGGSLFAWSGGQTVVKVRKLAYQNTNYLNTIDNTVVNPNMMAIRYNLLMMGYPSTTTRTDLNYGVYTWGAVEVTYPNSFGYDYVLSNGLQNFTVPNALKIGCVYNFVDTMYVSWSYVDGGGVTRYGLDVVNNSSTAATSFNWRSLIYDGGTVFKTKEAYRMQITFNTLPSGVTLQPFYSINRGADVLGGAATVGTSKVVFDFGVKRWHELQWGFKGTLTAGSTAPVITGVTMEVGPLPEEQNMTAVTSEAS
jgi:hypothetical protein